MSETTPPATANKPKSILASKTAWLQVIMLLAALVPPVSRWIAANPEGALTAIAAANVLMRFATSGKVSFFPPEGENDSPVAGGPLAGWIGIASAAGLMGLGLSSCTPAQVTAFKAIPIKACVLTEQGRVCYSDTEGLSAEIDASK